MIHESLPCADTVFGRTGVPARYTGTGSIPGQSGEAVERAPTGIGDAEDARDGSLKSLQRWRVAGNRGQDRVEWAVRLWNGDWR